MSAKGETGYKYTHYISNIICTKAVCSEGPHNNQTIPCHGIKSEHVDFNPTDDKDENLYRISAMIAESAGQATHVITILDKV